MAAALAGAARGGFGQQICWLHRARCALPSQGDQGVQGSPGRRSVQGAIPTRRPGKQSGKELCPVWCWGGSPRSSTRQALHLSSIKIYPGLWSHGRDGHGAPRRAGSGAPATGPQAQQPSRFWKHSSEG